MQKVPIGCHNAKPDGGQTPGKAGKKSVGVCGQEPGKDDPYDPSANIPFSSRRRRLLRAPCRAHLGSGTYWLQDAYYHDCRSQNVAIR